MSTKKGCRIEYNAKGPYRIVFPDGSHSEWQGYAFVATGEWQNKKFVAFSNYWDDSGEFNLVGVHEIIATSIETVKENVK